MIVILSKNKEKIFNGLNEGIELLIINYNFFKRNDLVYITKRFKQISSRLKTSILYLSEKKNILFDNGQLVAQLDFHNLEIYHIKNYDIILQDNLYSINLLSRVRKGKAIICVTSEYFEPKELTEQLILPDKTLLVTKQYSIYIDKTKKILKNNEKVVQYNIL